MENSTESIDPTTHEIVDLEEVRNASLVMDYMGYTSVEFEGRIGGQWYGASLIDDGIRIDFIVRGALLLLGDIKQQLPPRQLIFMDDRYRYQGFSSHPAVLSLGAYLIHYNNRPIENDPPLSDKGVYIEPVPLDEDAIAQGLKDFEQLQKYWMKQISRKIFLDLDRPLLRRYMNRIKAERQNGSDPNR